MEVNTLKIKLHADGGLGEMTTEDNSTYKTLLYAQNLWIGGMDIDTLLRLSAQTYRQSRVNFYPGPISNDPNAYSNYNQVYHVKLQTLTDFVNGVTRGIPPEIANWPAHGNTAMGEAANLAPFVDVDQDGTYDSSKGDYPDIKGDEALFAIYNDQNGDTTGNSLGIEVQIMIYGYNTGGMEDSALFVDYKLTNRSSETFTKTYLSFFNDFDLGNHQDDLIGTNVNADAIFAYNADDNDDLPSGFGTRPAASGVRILKGPPADYFDGVDNDKDGCIDGIRDSLGNCQTENPSTGLREHYKTSGSMYYYRSGSAPVPGPMTEPSTSAEHYSFMQSLWKNGNNLIIESPSGIGHIANGDGYVAANTGAKSLYMYPGNSHDSVGAFPPFQPIDWFESTTNQGDKRAMASAGPFSLTAGQSFEVNLGIVWSRAGDNLAGYDLINGRLEDLDEMKANLPIRNVSLRSLYPNSDYRVFYRSSSTEWYVKNEETSPLEFKLYSMNGQLLTIFEVGEHSTVLVPASSLPKGIYMLVNERNNTSHKITR